MEELTDDLSVLSVAGFLDQIADRTPTPGGGAVAAAAGALACAMGRMVAAYSLGKRTEPGPRRQVESAAKALKHADKLLRALITQDADAYVRMTTAAKAARGDASTLGTYEGAVLAAISVPMEMAAIACGALAAMDELKAAASKYLLSDLGVAAVLAEAAARAAWYCVRVNVRELTDLAKGAKVLEDIDKTVADSARLRDSIESFVRSRLEESGPTSR